MLSQFVHPLPPLTAPQLYQHVGLTAIRVMRRAFDLATGYGPNMTEAKWLQRMIFLETVAGVPGMVAGMLRHLKSLRTMKRDHGGSWVAEGCDACLLNATRNPAAESALEKGC